MEENTPTPLPEINPVVKALSHIIILMGLYFVFGVLFGVAGAYIAELITGHTVKPFDTEMLADLADPAKVNTYKIYLFISSVGAFIVSALIFTRFFARQNLKPYFGFKRVLPPGRLIIWVLLIAVAALPLLTYISAISRQMPLPEGISDDVITMQTTNDAISGAIIKADNFWVFLFNLLVIAVTPAIGEEMLFRGAFLQNFYRLFGNRIHLAVFVVAFLFSAVHLQVFNFVAILLIGVLFGYMYYWSGNIMVSIWAHFLNNAIVVVFGYLSTLYPEMEFFSENYEFGPAIVAASAVVLAAALYAFYRDTRPYHAQIEE